MYMNTDFRKRGAMLISQGKELLSLMEAHQNDFGAVADIIVADEIPEFSDMDSVPILNSKKDTFQSALLNWYFDCEYFFEKYGEEQHIDSFRHIDSSNDANRMKPDNIKSVIHIVKEIVNYLMTKE